MSSLIHKRHLTIYALALTILASIVLLANWKNQTSHIFFPKLKYGKSGLLALTSGELALRDGCLGISDPNSNEFMLVVWPRNYYITQKSNNLIVWKFPREKFAQVGDNVTIGGGGSEDGDILLDSSMLSRETIRQLEAFDCTGPFWLANI